MNLKKLIAGALLAVTLVGFTPVVPFVYATPIGGNSVTVTAVTPGTTNTKLGKSEDGAHSSGDVGVMNLGVRVDTQTSLSGTDGDYTPQQFDANGSLRVVSTGSVPGTAATSLGKAEDAAHTSGDTGTLGLAVRKAAETDLSAGNTDGDYEPLQVNSNGALRVQVMGNTAGGLSVYRNLDIDETTGTTTQQLKGSAGTLYTCSVTNDTAATKEYVKFYNLTALTGSAAGTDTPIMTLPIAGATTIQLNWGASGLAFDTGMTVAATTAIADNDTGAPAANAIIINCTYK